ncbi:MAG: hypothetical protein R3B06_04005 [Kofleriaceae bacterium]
MRPKHILPLLILLLATVTASADLSAVRYQPSGRGHNFLATTDTVPVGAVEAGVKLYLLADRWVVTYTEHKRRSANETEVVLERELAGRGGGPTLAGLGTLRELSETHNGKPVVELVLDQAIGSTPSGTRFRLAYIYGSWAPKSVTGR